MDSRDDDLELSEESNDFVRITTNVITNLSDVIHTDLILTNILVLSSFLENFINTESEVHDVTDHLVEVDPGGESVDDLTEGLGGEDDGVPEHCGPTVLTSFTLIN